MKTITLTIILAALALTAGQSQDLLQNRHGIGHGKDYRQASETYIARAPYVLEWSAKANFNLYDKDPTVKAKVRDTSRSNHRSNHRGIIRKPLACGSKPLFFRPPEWPPVLATGFAGKTICYRIKNQPVGAGWLV